MDFIWRCRYAHDLWNRLLHAMQQMLRMLILITIYDFFKSKNGDTYTVFEPK